MNCHKRPVAARERRCTAAFEPTVTAQQIVETTNIPPASFVSLSIFEFDRVIRISHKLRSILFK